MDDSRLITRSWLESLTTKELTALGDSWGIDLPPGLERIFVIEELMESRFDMADEEEDPETPPLRRAEFSELAPMPRQYNLTFIEVLIRDPLWAYTFWEIKNADKELYEKAVDFIGYFLKVVPVPESGAVEGGESFTVSVGVDDTAWYLGFPPEEGRYKVELCVLREGGELVLAVSAPFRLPKLLGSFGACGRQAGLNPLIALSGAEEFRVLRNIDRLARVKR
ncbi:MAG: DUF4912 domain-containing protein [Spirochaetaceae bacterium]|jgi:hypothetical protein|nr:DUF4912 domain-containing protein [Spirochaetaceae bacterium]